MATYHRQCRFYHQICLAMFAIGLILPLTMAFLTPSIVVSPAIWNFLQIGGLTGSLVFWMMKKFGKEAKTENVETVAAAT